MFCTLGHIERDTVGHLCTVRVNAKVKSKVRGGKKADRYKSGGEGGESTSRLTNTEKGVSWTFGKQEAIHNHLGEEFGDPGLRAKTTQGEGVRSVSGLA